jgi:hypothetical protein
MSISETPSARERRVDAAVAEYLEAAEAGQAPDRATFLARHPDLAAEVAAFFADQDEFARAAEHLGPRPADTPTSPTTQPVDPPMDTVRYFGDYELLEEIARGGMGVVYKARQVSLSRLVAVKMILAGRFASDTDVKRFRAEAEAVANLDHPHILPVYEVGEHQGQHYFSMKLVTGGSLASRLAELRGDLRAALALLVPVARAVHFAHQHGVLHRDLKPGNVLLEDPFVERPGGSLTAYVTDFGLSLRVAGGSRLTASGAVVGTPSYMSPEQARAEKALTVSADVYSLGAMLYELLTGRPPFYGASQVDTLIQVLEQEPEPPRRLNPAVARDLEAVCLKCLRKEPAGRYASAGELADDLERWLAGEGVSARPPSRGERLGRWVQRNPALAALLLAMLIGVSTAAFLPFATEGPVPQGLLTASFLTCFFAFMMLMGNRQFKALEERLRGEGPQTETGGRAPTGPSVSAAGSVPRGDLLRALWRGARNGAFLGAAAAVSLAAFRWSAHFVTPGAGGRGYLEFRPAILAAVVIVAVLAGAVSAVLTRLLIRPFGSVAWGTAWLLAGFAVVLGTTFPNQSVLSESLGKGVCVMIVLGPALAVSYDWWSRWIKGTARRMTSQGQIPSERGRILESNVPAADAVITGLPILLLVGGAIAGHYTGEAAGQATASTASAEIGAFLGSLIGRVAAALVGALLSVWLLRRYRVEEGSPWPGQADRPYPRALAVLYLAVSAVLAVVWLH